MKKEVKVNLSPKRNNKLQLKITRNNDKKDEVKKVKAKYKELVKENKGYSKSIDVQASTTVENIKKKIKERKV